MILQVRIVSASVLVGRYIFSNLSLRKGGGVRKLVLAKRCFHREAGVGRRWIM